MPTKLTTLLLLLCHTGFAQNNDQPAPTQFDKFITRPQIEWASYANVSQVFEPVILNKILLERFSKKEIKAALPVESGLPEANTISYLSKKSIDSILHFSRQKIVNLYDSEGNIISTKTAAAQTVFDTSAKSVTDVVQIYYIENGKPASYIPWVSPGILPVITSSGVFLGNGTPFSTCFNFSYNSTASAKDKIIWLSQSNHRLNLDTVAAERKLKELYGRNIVETLWPYIIANKYALYLTGSDKKIKAADINTELSKIFNEAVPIPVYDENGNATIKTYIAPFNPKRFTAIEFIQDWHYDYTKNIVFNKIKAAFLYAKKWDSDKLNIAAIPVLKIVFN
jgi:hypothetical protein